MPERAELPREEVARRGDALYDERVRPAIDEGGEREISAVVDTGFTGQLTLPPGTITALRLPQIRQSRALLADGSAVAFDVYEAAVSWDGRPRRLPVAEADTTPLGGMSLLEGHELRVEARTGGRVAITPLSPPG